MRYGSRSDIFSRFNEKRLHPKVCNQTKNMTPSSKYYQRIVLAYSECDKYFPNDSHDHQLLQRWKIIDFFE